MNSETYIGTERLIIEKPIPANRYDILQKLPDGQLWIGSCDTLVQAQQRIVEMKISTPDEDYAIFDLQDSRFVQGFSEKGRAFLMKDHEVF